MFLPLFEKMEYKPHPLGHGYLPFQCCKLYRYRVRVFLGINLQFGVNALLLQRLHRGFLQAVLSLFIYLEFGVSVSPNLNSYHTHPILLPPWSKFPLFFAWITGLTYQFGLTTHSEHSKPCPLSFKTLKAMQSAEMFLSNILCSLIPVSAIQVQNSL